MADKAQITVVSIMAVSSSIGVIAHVLPPLPEVHEAVPESDPMITANVRVGEVVSVTFLLAIGAIASAILMDRTPLIGAFIMSAILVLAYETTLRGHFFL